MNGINAILWTKNSSCKTDVFYMTLTKCAASVGTYAIITLLIALARLTSQLFRENLIFSGLISMISVVILFIEKIIKYKAIIKIFDGFK